MRKEQTQEWAQAGWLWGRALSYELATKILFYIANLIIASTERVYSKHFKVKFHKPFNFNMENGLAEESLFPCL